MKVAYTLVKELILRLLIELRITWNIQNPIYLFQGNVWAMASRETGELLAKWRTLSPGEQVGLYTYVLKVNATKNESGRWTVIIAADPSATIDGDTKEASLHNLREIVQLKMRESKEAQRSVLMAVKGKIVIAPDADHVSEKVANMLGPDYITVTV